MTKEGVRAAVGADFRYAAERPKWSPFPRGEFPDGESPLPYSWPAEARGGDLLTRFEEFTKEDFDLRLGAWIYFHLLDARKWVHRRVETIEILGSQSARRRVSVDFNLPKQLNTGPSGGCVVPLAVLKKEAITDFHLRDEQNRSVPVLTRYQNQFISMSLLLAVASTTVESVRAVPGAMNLLAALTYGGSAFGGSALKELKALGNKNSAWGKAIAPEGPLHDLCTTLAGRYLLLVPLSYRYGERRVLRFSYLETLKKELRLRDRFVWRPVNIHLDIPAVDEAASYHCEMQIPEGLEVASMGRTSGRVSTRDALDDPPSSDGENNGENRANNLDSDGPNAFARPWTRMLAYRQRRDRGVRGEAGRQEQVDLPSDVTVEGGRIHFKIQGVAPGTNAFAELWLRPVVSGLLRSARFYALFVCFALFFLWPRLGSLESRAGTTLLLSLSGLVSLFIVRSGEHGLASVLLLFTRIAVWGLAALLYWGALMIVTGLPRLPASADSDEVVAVPPGLVFWWGVISIAALVLTTFLFAISVKRQPRRQLPKPALKIRSAEGNLIMSVSEARDISADAVAVTHDAGSGGSALPDSLKVQVTSEPRKGNATSVWSAAAEHLMTLLSTPEAGRFPERAARTGGESPTPTDSAKGGDVSASGPRPSA